METQNLMNPTYPVASQPVGDLKEQEKDKPNTITEKVAEFVASINENLLTNYLLRGFIREDIENLTVDEFSDWVNKYDWEDLKKCKMPPSVSKAFKTLKQCFSASEEKKDLFLRDFKACHQDISQAREIITALGKLHDRFTQTFEDILEESEVRILEERPLRGKIENLFELLSDTSLPNKTIEMRLDTLFGNSFKKVDMARDLRDHNPYKIPLVERLLFHREGLVGKVLCLCREHDNLSTKIKDINKNQNLITITGEENTKITLTIHEEKKCISKIVWEQIFKESLDKFLPDELHPKDKTCQIYPKPELEDSADFLRRLLNGFYEIHLEFGEEGGGFLGLSKKRHYKQFNFIPTTPETKRIVCRIYDDEKDSWYLVANGGKQTMTGQWADFCNMWVGETRQSTHRNFDHRFLENRLYITQTEPVSNDSIKKLLGQGVNAKKDLIICLAEEDFYPFFASMFSGNPNMTFIHNLMEKTAIKKPLEILCKLEEITSGSDREELLLSFILKAVFLQLKKNDGATAFVLGDFLHLVGFLGQALDKAEALQGKRGILFTGSTGAGKSATVAYLIGYLMKIENDRFGETRVDTETESTKQASPPKIGHALGVSETIFTAPYELISTEAAVSSQSRRQKTIKIEVPQNINLQDVRLLDSPGRHDTRGTDYAITTNFSIDYSIASLEEVDAVVQVINYAVFLPQRSSLFMKELEDLSSSFPHVFQHEDLKKKVFFVITRQGDVSLENLQERIQELLKEERERRIESQKNMAYSSLDDKCLLLQFFLERLLDNGVILLSPDSSNQRIDILNRILGKVETKEGVSLKSSYIPSLSQPSMLRKFSQIVHGAFSQWKATLDAFFDLHEKLEDIEKDLLANQKEIKRKTQEITERKQRWEEHQNLISMLQEIEDQSSDDEALQLKVEDAQKVQILHTKLAIVQLKGEIENLDSLITSTKNAFEECTFVKVTLQKDIEQESISINKYSTGVSAQELVNKSFNKSSTWTSRHWKSSVDLNAKVSRSVDRGDGYISDSENSSNYESKKMDMSMDFTSYYSEAISKEHQLVPNASDNATQLKKLQEIRAGSGAVTFEHSDYSITIDQTKVEFIDIKPHNDGMKMAYGFKMLFNGQPPYPKLVITHQIPNKELNKTQIASCRDRISTWYEKLMDATKKISQLEAENKAQRKEIKQKLEQQKKMEATLVKQEETAEKIKQCQVNCEELQVEMATLQKDIEWQSINERSLQVVKEKKLFERKLWALFIESHSEQLNQTLKILKYFVQNQEKFSQEIESFNVQAKEVVKEGLLFLEYYQNKEKAITRDIRELLHRG